MASGILLRVVAPVFLEPKHRDSQPGSLRLDGGRVGFSGSVWGRTRRSGLGPGFSAAALAWRRRTFFSCSQWYVPSEEAA